MTLPDDWFDQLRATYPKRDGAQGWPIAKQKCTQLVSGIEVFDRMLLGTKNYAAYCKRTGKIGTELTMQAQRFYGPGMYWDEFADLDVRTPAEKAEDAFWAALEARASAMGFKTVDRSRGLSVARYAIEQAEKETPGLRVVK